MKFDVDDKNRCRLVCVKFHLNRCWFAAAVAKCLGAHFFGTQCILCSIVHTPVQSVSTIVIDLDVVFALLVFMLALLCFCVAAVFFGE